MTGALLTPVQPMYGTQLCVYTIDLMCLHNLSNKLMSDCDTLSSVSESSAYSALSRDLTMLIVPVQ